VRQLIACPDVSLQFLSSHLVVVLAGKNRLKATFVNPSQLKTLSSICFALAFASIIGSIAVWALTGGDAAESKAHAERFGIFIGLWAPTFFALSTRLDRLAESGAK